MKRRLAGLVRRKTTTTRQPSSYAIETRGCQMNVSDSGIVRRMLEKEYRETSVEEAEMVLLNTCAIRDKAEQKVWTRIGELKKEGKRVGVLGCMAERLKGDLLKHVEVVAGPDSYRGLPGLLKTGGVDARLGRETYADVRTNLNFVSIQRGCDNMCSFCVVPFTRGRERSRPVESIVAECEGRRGEITLLGQNVNSYADFTVGGSLLEHTTGFEPFVARKKNAGSAVRFAELLSRVSEAAPEARIRFTSPHPKDFPDDLLDAIAQIPNVAKNIHLPAQSGSNEVLARMRRGYQVETYEALVERARERIPNVTFSSDFIAGFCGETEEDHEKTLGLIRRVGYDNAFLFKYSKRPKTHAAYRYEDDVPVEVKKRRLNELISEFDKGRRRLAEEAVGRVHSVLFEGPAPKQPHTHWVGTNDARRKVIFPMAHHFFLKKGEDFVRVRVKETNGTALFGDIVS
ncbi:hypothetical protein CTAYLR_003451 [Chrysophaeum taylorii]|uniref:tRNA (N6-isopentenyl adenosine(37)-C2)-methylthiotransferase MiaB n=1 Tax=Chrysophaeum taylorii TaxID=2483200 RepID=A0AAD7U8Z8_9STRA|nr:hypothetical protein CTAYLR_003451 [Chrysophaeum taylorii]